MTLYYENSYNRTVNLMEWPIMAQNPETLLKNSWSYSTTSNQNNCGAVKNFYRDFQEVNLNISVMTESADAFNDVMTEMHKIFETDIRRNIPGKLWWNKYYKEVYAIQNSYNDFEELFDTTEETITFLTVRSCWIHEKTTIFNLGQQKDGQNLNYPYNYPFNYATGSFSQRIINESAWDCNFVLTVYGPCEHPSILIGNHLYSVDCFLDEGEYLILNSGRKRIYKVKINGETVNVFSQRDREYYIFQKIPCGSVPVSWNGMYRFNITLLEERNEPEWI